MTGNEGRWDELLLEVCAGDRSEDDPEVREVLRTAAARRRLRELRGLVAELDEEGSRRRAILAGLDRTPPAPGEEHVESIVRELAAGRASPEVSAAWPARIASVAALLALVAVAVFLSGRGDRSGRRLLGPDDVEIVAPAGEDASFRVFEWRGRLEGREFFRVSIYDGGDPLGLVPIETSPALRDTRWTPDPDTLRRLPRHIRFTVERLGASGDLRGAVRGEAWRSP